MAFPLASPFERTQAFLEFGLSPPTHVDGLGTPVSSVFACRIESAAGRFLLLHAETPLALAFEATLFDLLVESRFPAPRPRRGRGGGLIAVLRGADGARAAASCYAWPAGETVDPREATDAQLLEIGRLLGRLHRLGEAHPASVPEPISCAQIAASLQTGPLRTALMELDFSALPAGAAHGHLGPGHALYLGNRASAVLPSGAAHSGPLVLDLARAAFAWSIGVREPLAAIRAVASGYQGVRRLLRDEREAFAAALRCAAAQEGVRRLSSGIPDSLAPLHAVEALGADEIRAATG